MVSIIDDGVCADPQEDPLRQSATSDVDALCVGAQLKALYEAPHFIYSAEE